MKKLYKLSALLLTFILLCCSEATSQRYHLESERLITDKDSILAELKLVLNDEFELFYPLVIDTVYGGFFSDINYKWELSGRQNKMIVSQARHLWSVSNAASFYPDKKILKQVADQGFKFLKEKMWDEQYGGFYDLVNREAEPLKEGGKSLSVPMVILLQFMD